MYGCLSLQTESGMRTLIVASAKGGSGKTTLCSHLAVEAERCGDGPVGLLDVDPLGSLSLWAQDREAATPIFVQPGRTLTETVRKAAAAGLAWLMIDTPGHLTDTIASVLGAADLVLVPVRPGDKDLRIVGTTIEMVRKARRPILFAINQAGLRTRVRHETSAMLSEHGTVSSAIIHFRNDFATSGGSGLTVMEVDPASPASAEVAELWKSIRRKMETLHDTAA
jgi:chromosome partitioning protein